jgi:hypothetical protein
MLSKYEKILPDNLEKIREKLRNEALVKEYNRLRSHLKKKRRIIFFQKIALGLAVLLVLVLSSYILLPERQQNFPSVDLVAETPSYSQKTANPTVQAKQTYETCFHVRFEESPQFLLASFPQLSLAIDFCSELRKMNLPPTSILKDSVPSNSLSKEIVRPAANYSIQLGAFQYPYLKEFKPYLRAIQHSHHNGLHKYRLGPVEDYSEGKQLAVQLNLQQFYLVETDKTKTPTALQSNEIQQQENSKDAYLSLQNRSRVSSQK